MPHDTGTRSPDLRLAGDAARPIPSPALVIFDCDGVLIDSEIVVCRLTAEEFARLGHPMSTEEVAERFAGRPEREMVAELEAEWGHALPEEYFTRIKARIEQAYASELRIMPGILDLLDRLRAETCVASSSAPAKLRLGLEAVGLYERFAPDIVSASFVAQGKPAPDVFIYAAGRMQVPVTQCLVIEDSIPGVRAGIAAGMRVFGFAGGGHCGADYGARLLAAGAEQAIGRFDELEKLIPTAF